MVYFTYIMKIYTKTGDNGGTSLYDGSKVSKDHALIKCIGDIDELNAEVGIVIAHLLNVVNMPKIYIDILYNIQSHLFDIGALVAHPSDVSKKNLDFDLHQEFTKALEASIDEMTAALPKLVNFILPSGSMEMAVVHKCRTVCRRAERSLVGLKSYQYEVQNSCLIYLNRMSDFFFTLARYVGHLQNVPEVIYKKSRQG